MLMQIKDVVTKCIDPEHKIHFISFYTEGPPHDLCHNMTNVKDIYEKAITPYVDTVKFYTPRELKDTPDTRIYVEPNTSTPNPYNPGVHHIGFLKWKPYIILKHVENANFGDIIYYRDGNVLKYPSILENVDETRSLMELVLQNTDIFVPVENFPELKMKKNVKREIFEELGQFTHEYLEAFGFNSSIVICRKSQLSISILQEWLDGCMKDHLINYDTQKQQHPEYGWNVQEQSILNVILKKYMVNLILPMKYPFYSLNFRMFTLKDLTKTPKVAVLIAGESRNFDDINIIKNNHKYLFDKFNCDIFVSTWSKRGYSYGHGNSIQSQSRLETVCLSDVIKHYNNVVDVDIEDYDEWYGQLDSDMKHKLNKGFYNNHSTTLCPNTVYPQLYKIWKATCMKVAYEHLRGFQYDIVIRFRSDMLLVEPIPQQYLDDFTRLDRNPENKVFHLNPPGIFEPERIYDIFYYGTSHTMNMLADTWKKVNELIEQPFDNVLPDCSTCRVLYLQALKYNIEVIDIPKCIGDIYRNEGIVEYTHKVTNVFDKQRPGECQARTSSTSTPILTNTNMVSKCLRGIRPFYR